MTEKEKMLSGENYLSSDPELARDRAHARELLKVINTQALGESFVKENFLRTLFGAVGGNSFVESNFHCDYGYNIHVGSHFYANFNCVILDTCKVTIGNTVLLGPGVHIYTAVHPMDSAERAKGIESSKPVTIGNNVWVGGGAIINPGITIGNNVVVGSGSVVTHDVPDNVLVVGNPARIIRELT